MVQKHAFRQKNWLTIMSSMNKKRRGPAVCTTSRNNVRLELQELELLVNTLEVEAGDTGAAVVYTHKQLQALANKLRWVLFKELKKKKR